MKKEIVLLILLSILGIGTTCYLSFNFGKLYGENSVIMNQQIYGSGHEFFSSYNGVENVYAYEENSMTVKAITQLMDEEWQNIVIKDNGCILYNGNVHDLYDENILNCHVQEIANCDDDMAITIIIE